MKKHLILILILVLVAGTMAACGGGKVDGGDNGDVTSGYTDGVYEGEGEGFGGTITVSVEVVDGKIASVDIVDHGETDGVSDPAIEEIPAAIVAGNSTDVDAVSGATYSSEGIMEAVENALEAAK